MDGGRSKMNRKGRHGGRKRSEGVERKREKEKRGGKYPIVGVVVNYPLEQEKEENKNHGHVCWREGQEQTFSFCFKTICRASCTSILHALGFQYMWVDGCTHSCDRHEER